MGPFGMLTGTSSHLIGLFFVILVFAVRYYFDYLYFPAPRNSTNHSKETIFAS